MKTPIPLFKVFMSETAPKEVEKVLLSGYIGQGPKVEEFEELLRRRFNNDFIATTNSGTSAEHLALHLLKKPDPEKKWPGLEIGDEVLAAPLTCTATNWPSLANNLRLKWVDIDEKTLNMDLDDLARKITHKTKVIMFVHWGGYPVDLDRIKKIQRDTEYIFDFRPAVIEDSAHAFGSTYKGQPIGNHGNFNTFTFQAIKHLTSVDGGMLISPDQEYHRRAKLIRWYGIDRETNKKDFRCELDIPEWGFKFHMNDVNATIGIENLKKVDWVIQRHQENADYYNKELQDVPGVTLLENAADRTSAYWIYSMLVENKQGFMDWMKENGIIVSQVHERNDIHSCVREFKTHLPTLDRVVKKTISIPVGWWVTEEQREYIADTIKKGW